MMLWGCPPTHTHTEEEREAMSRIAAPRIAAHVLKVRLYFLESLSPVVNLWFMMIFVCAPIRPKGTGLHMVGER